MPGYKRTSPNCYVIVTKLRKLKDEVLDVLIGRPFNIMWGSAGVTFCANISFHFCTPSFLAFCVAEYSCSSFRLSGYFFRSVNVNLQPPPFPLPFPWNAGLYQRKVNKYLCRMMSCIKRIKNKVYDIESILNK